jgi:hypothetical protein
LTFSNSAFCPQSAAFSWVPYDFKNTTLISLNSINDLIYITMCMEKKRFRNEEIGKGGMK